MPASDRTHPTEAHRQLDAFVGHWHAEGKSYADGQQADDPRATAVDWDSDEVYEWMEGGYFLVHRWDATVGKRVFRGTEIIGHDPQGGYFTRFFDNAGHHPEYKVAVDGDTWTFEEPGTRATVAFADDGASLEIAWQWRNDGSDWLPLCDLVSRRVD